MKLSIVIPVYYNEQNLKPLYEDIVEKVVRRIDYEYELVMVDDGSKDRSFEVMKELAGRDPHIRIFRLSRNFGSHAAILCGLEHSTGDCAVVKAADLQEPTELVLDMVSKWREGYRVVLATREAREEGRSQTFFANFYYALVRKTALPSMPKNGFDVYLVDRKVIRVLTSLEEKNSALTGQILWSGFRTAEVSYVRKEREIGTSRWTLQKKIRLVMDTLFSFSTLPVKVVEIIGGVSFVGAAVWALMEVILKITGQIEVTGFALMFIFQLFSFGIIMLTIGIIGEYLWRTFDASRKRPPYIIEETGTGDRDE